MPMGMGVCPLVGDIPPPLQKNSKEEEKLDRKIKKRKEKQRKVGSKQMGQNWWILKGVIPLNPNFFDPVPLKIF